MRSQRTTLVADASDLVVLKEEARRRGISLAKLLGEVVGREAAAIRSSLRPRVGVVDRRTDIARAMEEDLDGPARSEFRAG